MTMSRSRLDRNCAETSSSLWNRHGTGPSSHHDGDPIGVILKSFFHVQQNAAAAPTSPTPEESRRRTKPSSRNSHHARSAAAAEDPANDGHEFLWSVDPAAGDVLREADRSAAEDVTTGGPATDCAAWNMHRLSVTALTDTNSTDNISRALGDEGGLWSLSAGEMASFAAVGVVLGAICLATVVGNALVLVAIVANGHLRGTTHYFIANLAVADLLLGVAVLPFSATLETIDRWVFGETFCDVWAALDVLCCTASILSLCVISVDRYVGVTRPLRHSAIMTERRAGWVVVGVWLLSFAISVAPLFGWKEPREPGADAGTCDVTKQTGYVLFSVAGSFYIPLAVILVVYYRVYREAVRQSRFLATGVKTTDLDCSGSSSEVTLRVHTGRLAVGGAGGSRKGSVAALDAAGHHRPTHLRVTVAGKLAKFKREKKAAKTLGIVVGVFVLCWFPFFFVLPLGQYVNTLSTPN